MDRPEQTSTPTMATQNPSPSTPPVDSSSTPGSKTPIPVSGDGNDVKPDAANEFSGKPSLREDQVQNAVKFLSHPRVRSSPVVHRRSFLEKKGLTKEEIDEAFHRVPDPPSNATSGEAFPTNPAMQKPSTTLQRQDPGQTPQQAAAPVSVVSTFPTQQLPRFNWSHALLAAGVLAASGAGTAVLFKNMVIPRLKAWIKKVVTDESESEELDSPSSKLAEEAAEAAKAAASAAASVAKASQELLSTKNEERKYFEAFMGALDVQVNEMKSMGDAIRRLESRRDDRFSEDKLIRENILSTSGNGPINNAWGTSQVNRSDHVKVNGASNTNFGEVRPSSPPAFMKSLSVPNQNSYIEPWKVAQQAEQRPSYAMKSQSSYERLSSKIEESYGPSSEMTGNAHDASEPWWTKQGIKVTEIEPEEEPKQFHYGIEANERPKQRGWLPPQPPAVALPEAAAAIRRPKPPVQKQQTGDEQSVASSDDGKEGEMRVPDSAAVAESLDSMPAGISQSEIQEERVVGLEVS